MAQFTLFWIQKDWIEDIYIIIIINTQNKDVTRATAFTAVTGPLVAQNTLGLLQSWART